MLWGLCRSGNTLKPLRKMTALKDKAAQYLKHTLRMNGY